ncbi:MAG: hypothetical protein GTO02_11500 [Candidatus Dadabacteria bacterium]|nr:hypothetical protein [Candidatus Dadabacteria bacterium]NIQ14981.1 hypothetical protein [Candidatus Dadabacteria bacterium]
MFVYIILIILSGALATLGMTIFMDQISRRGIANANMVQAIGSIFSKKLDEGYQFGLFIHFLAGIIIGFIYFYLISLFSPNNIYGFVGVGVLIGLFHGFAFSFMLVIAVAEHHPLEKYRSAGFEVALAHFAGHLIYGLIIGFLAGFLKITS